MRRCSPLTAASPPGPHERSGRPSVYQVGAHLLESSVGGRGILLGGVPGVERANVVIIGGGNVAPMQPKWLWAWVPMSPFWI